MGKGQTWLYVVKQLTWKDCEHILAILHGHNIHPIVVGGQAVNFWVERYRGSGAFELVPYASKDVDVLGPATLAQQCASALHGSWYKPKLDHATPESATVEVSFEGAKVEIDFLPDSLPSTREKLERTAVPFEMEWGDLYIMHPILCLKSRTFNVTQVPDKYDNEHGVRQLQASIEIVRCFAREEVESNRIRAVLDGYKDLFIFAKSRFGKAAWSKKGIDVFSCVDPLDGLPEKFRTECYPRWRDRLQSIRNKAAKTGDLTSSRASIHSKP